MRNPTRLDIAYPERLSRGLVLVVIAAVIMAFTEKYPKSLFDLILDRWVLRVAAYTALTMDTYPPFRLDMGGIEPTGPEQPS